jgi:hypothetical protein
LRPYLTVFRDLADCRLVLCTRPGAEAGDLLAAAPFATLTTWSLSGFPDVLRSSQLTVLTHEGDAASRAKSNNRMIASIAWGVPALVSRTPAYLQTAAAAGVPEAVFGGPADLALAIERLRPAAARVSYLQRAQPVVWQHHAPEGIARRLADILRSSDRGQGRLTGPLGKEVGEPEATEAPHLLG